MVYKAKMEQIFYIDPANTGIVGFFSNYYQKVVTSVS